MIACDKTVTLVKCDGTRYSITVISGVSWYDKNLVAVENGGLVHGNETKVRIPMAVIPETLPSPGDKLVLGALAEAPASPADLAAYRCVTVMSVGDNRRGRMPHVGVLCK